MYGEVVHARQPHGGARLGLPHGRAALRPPPFEEGEGVRIEQVPSPRRDDEVPVRDPQVHGPEQRDEPRIRPEAPVHRVRIPAVIGLERAEQAEDGIALREEGMFRGEEPAIFAVEQEHEPQQDGEEARVQVVVAALHGRPERACAVPLVRGGEPGEEGLQRLEHLAGEGRRDVGVALAALREDGRELLVRRDAEPPLAREEHDEGVEDAPPAHGGHVGRAKRDPPARLAVGGVDKAHLMAVGEEADVHAARPEEPFELGLRGVLPRPGRRLGLVQPLHGGGDLPDEHGVRLAGLRRGGAVGRGEGALAGLVPSQSAGGAEELFALRDIELEVLRQGVAGVEAIGREIEHRLEEAGEVADAEIAVRVLFQARDEGGVRLAGLLLGALGLDQHGDRDDEPLRGLRHPQPLLVKTPVCGGHGESQNPVVGQRYTRPTGTSRWRLTV